MTEISWGPRRSKPRRKYGKKNVRPATDPHHEINHRRDFPGPILCHQDNLLSDIARAAGPRLLQAQLRDEAAAARVAVGDTLDTPGAVNAGSRAGDDAEPVRNGGGVALDGNAALAQIAFPRRAVWLTMRMRMRMSSSLSPSCQCLCQTTPVSRLLALLDGM